MARDTTGRGTPEDQSKTSGRGAHIADHLIKEDQRRAEGAEQKGEPRV